MIRKIIQYITHDIWVKKEHEYKSRKMRWAVRQFKVFIFTAQGFGQHGILVRPAALTFYSADVDRSGRRARIRIAKGSDSETRLNGVSLQPVPAVYRRDRPGDRIRQRDVAAYQGRTDRFGGFGRAVLGRAESIREHRKRFQQHLGSAPFAQFRTQIQRLYDRDRRNADPVDHLQQYRAADTKNI